MLNAVICEDDPVQAVDLAHIVQSLGHTVVGVFSDGKDALRAAAVLKPDVALIDLHLRDGSTGGSAAVKFAGRGCSIVVISGLAEVSSELGSIPHLRIDKPVPPTIIGALLTSIAKQRCLDD